LFILVYAFSLGPVSAIAQSKAVALTGCLVEGDKPEKIWLVAKSGTIYGLESSAMSLKEHLGQKVLVRGDVISEGEEGVGEQPQAQRKKTENADVRVVSLKMLSRTCTH
jgi:hypothetical protein